MNRLHEIHEMAVRLCEGDAVWLSGLLVRAKRVPEGWSACNECAMDSACTEEMQYVCIECDNYDLHQHLLYIAK